MTGGSTVARESFQAAIDSFMFLLVMAERSMVSPVATAHKIMGIGETLVESLGVSVSSFIFKSFRE